MKIHDLRYPHAYITSVFFLTLIVTLSGCQALSRRAPSPTPTPILLGPQEATVQHTATSESSGAAAPTPALPMLATASPIPSPTPATISMAPDSIMALGTRATIVLRARAAPGAEILAQVPGSQVLWAQGRNSAGDWLWVVYNEAGRHGWVAAADVKLLGDLMSLTDVTPGAVAESEAEPTVTPAPTLTTSGSAAVIPPTMTAPTATVRAATTPTRGPTRARTPTPSLPGKIAFQTALGGDIYLMNADGTGLRQVTSGFDPALSPDGTQLAFVRWGNVESIYLLDLQTGQERQLATAQHPRAPAWSPDGSKVVFCHNTALTTCLATPFGCFLEEDVRDFFGGQECINSPQGRFCIADFSERQVDLTDLAQLTLADGSWLDLPSQRKSQSPTWHPNGNEILYTGRTGLQILSLGQATRPLVNDVTLGSPVWSPDGQRIAVQAHKHDHWDIVLLDAAGNLLAQLTAPQPLAAQKPNNVAPTWAPDGRSLLFLSDRDGAWRVYRMNADGTQQAPFLPQILGGITFNYEYAAERVLSWSK